MAAARTGRAGGPLTVTQTKSEQAIDNIDLRFLGAQIAQVAETAATNLEIMLTAIKAR